MAGNISSLRNLLVLFNLRLPLFQIIASVGLDKKLYTYDSGSRRPSSCISYEAPFSSLAFKDDGLILAAGTSNGRVVFYDVRGKPQPFTVLRAYNSSEVDSFSCIVFIAKSQNLEILDSMLL